MRDDGSSNRTVVESNMTKVWGLSDWKDGVAIKCGGGRTSLEENIGGYVLVRLEMSVRHLIGDVT